MKVLVIVLCILMVIGTVSFCICKKVHNNRKQKSVDNTCTRMPVQFYDYCIVCDRHIPNDEVTVFSNINGIVYRTCRYHSVEELNEAIKRVGDSNENYYV